MSIFPFSLEDGCSSTTGCRSKLMNGMESYHAKEKLRVGATSTAMLSSVCGVSNGTE